MRKRLRWTTSAEDRAVSKWLDTLPLRQLWDSCPTLYIKTIKTERFISRLHSDSFGYLKFAWKFSFSYSIIEKLFFDHIHFHTKTLWLKLHYQLQGIWMLERKCTGHVHNDKFRLRMFTQIEMRYSKDLRFFLPYKWMKLFSVHE